MNHEEIKNALHDKGLTFAALAQASGKRYQTLTACSMRKATSQPAARIIAAGLGLDIQKVFPDVASYSRPSRQGGLEKAKAALEKANIDVPVE